MTELITTYYLELLATGKPCDLPAPPAGFSVIRAQRSGSVNRSLYERVGGDWHWTDQLIWSDQQWRAYASRPQLETWVASVEGLAAGYFELDTDGNGNTEIAYFGLLPAFLGRGLGKHLLCAAIQRAWESGATRIWVHTCTLDHPHALGNYLARGFTVYRHEIRPRPAAPLRQENHGVS